MQRFCLTLILLLVSGLTCAGERIHSFHSDIHVRADGGMQVIETIRVAAEGVNIKRGIFRDFPTDYRDRLGHRYRVDFRVISVERDGVNEPWFTEQRGNGVRVYIGRKDVRLPHGDYTYTLTYQTNRQLGFFEDHDELYWNVTGNGWVFAIDEASATVTLPGDIPANDIRVEGYTGYFGDGGQDFHAEVTPDGRARFITTRVLQPEQGLTVVVSWPKGFVTAPELTDQAANLLRDNRSLLIGLLGLFFLVTYYFLVWQRVGRDPDAGVIIPHYTPPKGYTPAAMRFIDHMGYDHKTFATGLVNLAVKGFIEITDDDGDYIIRKKVNPPDQVKKAAGERALMKKLFKVQEKLELEQKNHSTISAAIDAHKASLKRNYERKYFATNSLWVIPGVIASIAMLLFAALSAPVETGQEAGIFMVIWLSGWTFGVFFVLRRAIHAWRGARGFMHIIGAVFATLFALPFVVGEGFGIYVLGESLGFGFVLLLLTVIGTNYAFYNWLKAPTRAGRKLLDKLHGFKMYMEVAEKDELNLRNPPQKTPALFEVYLPFAMALDVEQVWAEKFAAVFQGLAAQGQRYAPAWYHGAHWDGVHTARFSSSLGSSLSSSIASSSTAPGSSSGGGGGGFSGGGGGGGGGGGW